MANLSMSAGKRDVWRAIDAVSSSRKQEAGRSYFTCFVCPQQKANKLRTQKDEIIYHAYSHI